MSFNSEEYRARLAQLKASGERERQRLEQHARRRATLRDYREQRSAEIKDILTHKGEVLVDKLLPDTQALEAYNRAFGK